jgi:hypothetical protein
MAIRGEIVGGASRVHCEIVMDAHEHIILIHPQAPNKPVWGAPCNGCGICCLVEPCPLGMLLSGKKNGACHALRWSADASVYRCGAVVDARGVLARTLPKPLRWLIPALSPLLRWLSLRWIAAGVGCDSTIELAPQLIEMIHD